MQGLLYTVVKIPEGSAQDQNLQENVSLDCRAQVQGSAEVWAKFFGWWRQAGLDD
jgi:hypothetical protein